VLSIRLGAGGGGESGIRTFVVFASKRIGFRFDAGDPYGRNSGHKEEAERLLKFETFDLAIVDLRLTGNVGLEGLELISKIKAQTPGTQAVLFTAYGSLEIEQEAVKRGAVEYREKSLQLPVMLDRLNALGIPAGHERKRGGEF